MNSHHRHDGAQRQGTCMALVDGRYMAWLLGQNQEMVTEALSRQSLAPVLSALLHQAGVAADVLRGAYRFGVYGPSDAAEHVTLLGSGAAVGEEFAVGREDLAGFLRGFFKQLDAKMA